MHGLRGEMKVLSRTDFDELRFRPKSRLYIRADGQTPIQEVTVKTARRHHQFWLVTFDGLSSIHDVERWKGMELCVHRAQLPALPADRYYLHELTGMSVYLDDGRYAGELTEVLSPGANDVYVVQGPLLAKDLLIPAIPDCILNVDKDGRRMTIHLLPGLMDGDDSE